MIENKQYEKEQWKAIAMGTTAQMGGERVQTSSSQQKMADAVGKYIDLEKEVDDCIDRLIEAKKDVISVIEQLNVVEYDVAHKLYVQYVPLEDVADLYDRTCSWVKTVRKRIFRNVQRILDERKNVS